VPSSVVAVGCSVHSGSSWFRNRSSFRVFAPMMNARRFALTASFLAKKSSGAVPVPPPTMRILPLFWVKLFPKGPRTPMVSPCFMLFNARVASPTVLTVTETLRSAAFIMLSGISSTFGIQSMRNCPGLAFAQSLSVKVKVLVVWFSVFTLWMRVVRNVLAAVREADNFFYAPKFFLFQVSGYSTVYGLEDRGVFLGYGGADLDGGCAREEEFDGVLPRGYAATADDGRFHLFADVVDASEGDGFHGWT
jgi:hypothetical protein